MQCLYCGKGIGPIRQLRDLEFCSEAHRTQFRERYRQQVYEALAPEPAPVSTADFIGRAPVASGPAPAVELRVLSKPMTGERLPGVRAERAGVCVERPTWVISQELAGMPARLAWRAATVGTPARTSAPRRCDDSLQLLMGHCGHGQAASTDLRAAESTGTPWVGAPHIAAPSQPPAHPVSLPGAGRIPAPTAAQGAVPQLRAAVPVNGDPAAIGRVSPPAHAVVVPASQTATASGPAAPAAIQAKVSLAPAIMASAPRPREAGPLWMGAGLMTVLVKAAPVVFDASIGPKLGIILPKPPNVAASSPWISAIRNAQPVQPEPRPAGAVARPEFNPYAPEFAKSLGAPSAQQCLALAAAVRLADPEPAPPAPRPLSRVTVRMDDRSNVVDPLGRHASPRVECSIVPAGALAGALESTPSPVEAPAANQSLRSAAAVATAPTPAPVAQQRSAELPGMRDAAPPGTTTAPKAAAPPAAAPSWDAVPAALQHMPLVPKGNVALPHVAWVPMPARAVDGPGASRRADGSQLARSSAVLWTLRLARMCNPAFRFEAVRARFMDLLDARRTTPYVQDVEDIRGRKPKVLQFKRLGPRRLSKPNWPYIGAAAAALLVGGVLLPKSASKSVSVSIPWSGTSVRQWMTARATRDFADNFRGGLTQWQGVKPKWPQSWSYSRDGFMHPGQLALYRPSVPLSDYRFEFLAQVENKSVDWVVRAKDADNYYALKFTVIQPGPRPMMAMVRYPVIGGHPGSRVQTPLRMMIHANTPYRVTVDVKGNKYRAYIEDQVADFWTDDRLKAGGVGFFSEASEHARVYWVKLESHGDILGRICGLLSGKSGRTAEEKEIQAMDYRHTGIQDIRTASVPARAEAGADTAQDTRISKVLSKAAALHLDGKLDEGAKELMRALDAGERHPALYFALGQLQYELQQYGPAAQNYTQAAILQPLHPTAHFNAAVCLGRSERWEDAAAAFRKAISNDPARTEAQLALGACLVQLGSHNEALEAYDRFLERHPDHEEALFGKAVALQKRDRSSEAAELYRRILNRSPQSEEALSNLVSLSLVSQDYEQVRKYAQRLAESHPKSQIAMEGLAGAAFAAGDHKAAADYSRQLAELAPQVFENWFNLGVACHKAGDLASAAKAYTRATRVQPDSPQAHLNLGVALQEQGDLKAARTAYEQALQIDPNLAGVHWNLGLVHEQLGSFETAEKLYIQVPTSSPDADDAAFRIGHLRLQRADYPGAIQAFETCLQKRPIWPEAHLNLGIAHWRDGNKEAARTCFQELTASGCDSKEALRGLAALSLEHQEYDKAFEIYRQLLDAGERSPELLYNAGLICQRRGQPEDAAVLYREALKGDPQFGEALLNLGHALMSLGNEFEARSCWRKAVIAKPELAQRYFEPAAQAS